MLESQTHFATPNASRYLQQLCKHFAHKITVEHDDKHGRIELPAGTCTLRAADDDLEMTVTSESQDKLERAQSVIEDHLKRFAFREDFGTLDWSAPVEQA